MTLELMRLDSSSGSRLYKSPKGMSGCCSPLCMCGIPLLTSLTYNSFYLHISQNSIILHNPGKQEFLKDDIYDSVYSAPHITYSNDKQEEPWLPTDCKYTTLTWTWEYLWSVIMKTIKQFSEVCWRDELFCSKLQYFFSNFELSLAASIYF